MRQRNPRRRDGAGRRGLLARRTFGFEGLEARALLSADVARLIIHVDLSPRPTPQIGAVVTAAGASLRTTDLRGVLEAVGSPSAVARAARDLAHDPDVVSVEPEQTVHVARTPNDPSFQDGSLWSLNAANGIQAQGAWDVTTGSTAVTVATVDTGVDYNHPDLYKNIWLNQAEIPPSRLKNLADVDGDGRITFRDLNDPRNIGPGKITDVNGDGRIDASDVLAPMQKDASGNDTGLGGWADGISEDGDTRHVDDLVGWNFVNNTNDPLDDFGHGTQTAGIIGAVGDNATGVVGVNWVTQIMPLKFLDGSGQGTYLGAAEAVRYATDHGARVSNHSYAGPGQSPELEAAVQYAALKHDVVVAAAGNGSTNTDVAPNAPSSFPESNLIAVAATDHDGSLASFSSYGAKTVDVGAPGVDILSTARGGGYTSGSGTSFAAPQVAGTVALVLARHPDWTDQQVIQRLYQTVTPDASLQGKTVTGGIINAQAALAADNTNNNGNGNTTLANGVQFVGIDTTTQGSWRGAYGGDGFDIAQDPGPANPSVPSYATVRLSGQGGYTWSASTAQPRALQKSDPGAADREAGVWYASDAFSVDVRLGDGRAHRLAAYALDWDYGGSRGERVDVVDDATGAVLDSRSVSGFQGGAYLVWDVRGSVTLRVTNTAGRGNNAVLSGLFFGAAGPSTTPSSAFVGRDTTTQGNWKGVYGAEGYAIAQDPSPNNTILPAYAATWLSGQSNYVWNGSTSQSRALQKAAPGSPDRLAATWYGSSFHIVVQPNDAKTHQVALYALDWDYGGARSERIDLINTDTGSVIDTQTISGFQNGVYLVWNIHGNVDFRVTNLGNSPNAVVSGLFFGGASATQAVNSATFVGQDNSTQGSWRGVYGGDGFDIAQDPGPANPSVPSYATVRLSGQGGYTWSASTAQPRALQKSDPGAADREAGVWYASDAFSVDVRLGDGRAHRLAAYALDWDYGGSRGERVDVVDDATGAVLDSRSVSGFQGGAYLVWDVRGSVTLRVTNTAGRGNNAVLSGLFFGKPS